MVTARISNALGAQASCLPASSIRLPREQAGCLRSQGLPREQAGCLRSQGLHDGAGRMPALPGTSRRSRQDACAPRDFREQAGCLRCAPREIASRWWS